MNVSFQVIGARMTKKLIILTLVPPVSGQLVGVIGAHSSDLSKIVADFLRVFKIPQISYGSTASDLSNKEIYDYFFRTVPPDKEQAKTIADICVDLNWTYVITVHSEGLYGEKGMEDFRTAAKKQKICFALHLQLSAFPKQQEYDELVNKMNKESAARAVVTFLYLRDTREILKALKRNKVTKTFYWLGSDSWGNNLNAVKGLETYAEGAITLTQLDEPVKGFEKYFRNLSVYDPRNINNSWLKEYWQSHFQCNLPGSRRNFAMNCSGDESLASGKLSLAPVQTVVNAVYAMAQALHDYMEERKPQKIDRSILRDYLKNVTFEGRATGQMLKFNKNQDIFRSYSIHSFQKREGHYMYWPVGVWNRSSRKLEWNMSMLNWPHHHVSSPPVSICHHGCANGFYRQKRGNHDPACCWNCAKCKTREVVIENKCSKCDFGETPDTNQSKCIALPTLDAFSFGSSQALLAVSILGLVFVIISAAIFFKHSDAPLIKASSRELSGIILLGLALLFIFPWLLVAKPTSSLCISQPLVLGVALSSCYAPLFMKILRIYRIFKTAQKSAGKPILISPTSQVLIAIGLITIQLLFSSISFFPAPPKPTSRETDNAQSLFLECSVGKDIFATLLSYNMFLMILCTIMAFKTRKFPRNFNEAKYIGFTMYFTCFVWIIFFPSYLSTGNGLDRIIWECTAVVLVGWITLIGLFGPKICHLVMGNHLSVTSDQLAVTGNTVSQAAVVMPSFATDSSVDSQPKREEGKEKGEQQQEQQQQQEKQQQQQHTQKTSKC